MGASLSRSLGKFEPKVFNETDVVRAGRENEKRKRNRLLKFAEEKNMPRE